MHRTGESMEQSPVIKDKLARVARLRKKALSLPARKAMDLIIDSPDAPAVVHSMAEQDFYLMVNEIGPEDAIELISLASDSQWEYILDTDSWKKEEINNHAVVKWFDLLMEADADRFLSWMTSEKKDFLELFFYYHIEAAVREHDQEPSEFDDDFFTFDDVYYFRFIKKGPAVGMDDKETQWRDNVLYGFLKRLADTDYIKYQELLFYSSGVIPAEAEEEAYRLRNVRLAEKGFLPFEEAIGIYQPLRSKKLPAKPPAIENKGSLLPVPMTQLQLMDGTGVFERALNLVDSGNTIQELCAEFAALCNNIAVADQVVLATKKELGMVVRKACGYLSIGFARLCGNMETGCEPSRAASLMKTAYLADIFRTGYGVVMELKNRAVRWRRSSWWAEKGLPLAFWGERRGGALGGLLVKRPLFYDHTDGLYREFGSVADVRDAESLLREIMVIDDLLLQADIDPSPVSPLILTVDNLLLTLWARSVLGLPVVVEFIPSDRFRLFFADLMTRQDSTGPSGFIKDELKQSFLSWLSDLVGVDPYKLSRDAGLILTRLFDKLEDEYRDVLPDSLDPRHIHMFLVC